MAITIASLLKPFRFRPIHCDDLTAIYTGNAEDTYSAAIDQSAVKTAINSAQGTLCDTENTAILALRSAAKVNADALIETFKTLWPFADETAFDTACDVLKGDIEDEIDTIVMDNAGLKTDLATEVNTGVPSTANILKTTVIAAIKTEINNEIIAEYNSGTNFIDSRCGGTGREPNPITGTAQHCLSCDGLGVTAVQNSPTVSTWVATNEIELD